MFLHDVALFHEKTGEHVASVLVSISRPDARARVRVTLAYIKNPGPGAQALHSESFTFEPDASGGGYAATRPAFYALYTLILARGHGASALERLRATVAAGVWASHNVAHYATTKTPARPTKTSARRSL